RGSLAGAPESPRIHARLVQLLSVAAVMSMATLVVTLHPALLVIPAIAAGDGVRRRSAPVPAITRRNRHDGARNRARTAVPERSAIRPRPIPAPVIDEVPIAAVPVHVIVVVAHVIHACVRHHDDIRLRLEV